MEQNNDGIEEVTVQVDHLKVVDDVVSSSSSEKADTTAETNTPASASDKDNTPSLSVDIKDDETTADVKDNLKTPSDPVVVQLRTAITSNLSELLSDSDCLRFLRARNGNVTKAADMINKWGTWWDTVLPGTEVKPGEVTSKPDEQEAVYSELMPHANLGESREGHPIYWEKTGQISSQFHVIKKRMTEDALFVRHIRQQEVMVRRLKNASARHNKPIEKQVIVMDMKNVSMSMDFMALRVFKRTVVVDEACYPERLETLFMINAPFTFSVLWAMIKPWIDPVTVSKFQILGSNYQAALKERISEEHIPVEYGGTAGDFAWTFPNNIAEFDRYQPPCSQQQDTAC